MKLYADQRNLRHTITACETDFVAVDGQVLRRSLLLTPTLLDPDWGPDSFAALDESHMRVLAEVSSDVILLGVGLHHRFPATALLRPLIEAGLPVEVMTTAAACRTYNVLIAEGRAIAAALIIDSAP